MSHPALIIRPEAELDLADTFAWYEEQAKGFGTSFLDAAEEILERVQANPRLYPIVHKSVRRALMRRFPYAVFYVETNDSITILSVMHGKRDPEHWRKRC